MSRISDLTDLMAEHRHQELQLGSQLFITLRGQTVASFADGEARPGEILTVSHMMRWYQAAMPLLTVEVGRLLERGKLGLDDTVGRYLPEWSLEAGGKNEVTIRHLLTHMGGFAGAELADRDISDEDALSLITAYRAEYRPGTRAGFHPSSGWRILGAVVETVERGRLDRILHRQVLRPLRMRETMLHLGDERARRRDVHVSPVHWSGYTVPSTDAEGEPIEVPHHRDVIHNTAWHQSRFEPAMSIIGPASDLAAFYDSLASDPGSVFRSPLTLDLLTSAHRVGVRDRTFNGAQVPWGLGFQVAGSFGGSMGHRTYGHGGLTGRAIHDPVDQLTMVYLTNGLANQIDHERRMTEMTEAVYDVVVPRSSGASVTTTMPAVGAR